MGRARLAAPVADDGRVDTIGRRLPGEGSRWFVGDREPFSLAIFDRQDRIDGRADRDPLDEEGVGHVLCRSEAVREALLRRGERP